MSLVAHAMDPNAFLARLIGLLAVILSLIYVQPAFALRVLNNPAAAHAAADSEASLAGASAATAIESKSGPEAASVMQSGAADPCTLWSEEIAKNAASWDVAKPSTVRECLRNFKIRESDVEDLRSVVNGVNNHYVYKDIAVDSPDQTNLPSNVDIVAELTAILKRAEQGEYERLMDAHVDTFNALNGLNDGHTMFSSNCFFSTASFFLPLPLFAVVEDGQQIVRVATRRYLAWFDGIEEDAKKIWGFDFSAYELQQVVSIEGQPAAQYIKQWADKHGGMVRNPSARFNMMFAGLDPQGKASLRQHPGEFALRELVPESDSLQVSILSGGAAENVSVPWIAVSSSEAFTDSHSYWTLNCAKHQEPCADDAAAGNAASTTSSSSSSSSNEERDSRKLTPVFQRDVLRRRPQYKKRQQPHRRQQQPQQQPQERQEQKEQGSDAVTPRILAGEDGAAITVERVSAEDAYYLLSLPHPSSLTCPTPFNRTASLAGVSIEQTAVIALHTIDVDSTTASKLAATNPALQPSTTLSIPPRPYAPLFPSQVYLVSNRTAVIVLHTFDVDSTTAEELAVTSPDVHPVDYLAGEILRAMDAARRYARPPCSPSLLALRTCPPIFPSQKPSVALLGTRNVPLADATLPMDFIIGTNFTWSLVADQAIPDYATDGYTHPNDGASVLSSSQDYTPLQNVSFTEAGRAGTYTADFKSYFENFYGGLAERAGSAEPFFGARPFLFLADGDCFSTCAILTHMLGKRYKVPMVTVGGYLDQPMSVSASCLGYTMLSLNCAVSVPLSRTTHANDPRASKPFKTNMDVSMAFTNGYVDSSVPCEFEFLPSQRHVDYTVDRIDKPWVIWSDVAKLFPELPLPPVLAQSQAAA
ncbi:unnamed protein product [Closterium sp. NIES-54]